MKRIVCNFSAALVFAGIGVGAAQAQDGLVNWSGFYAGAHAGWTSGDWDGRLDSETFINAPAYAFVPETFSTDDQSGIFGFQAGYNHQINQFVFGFEGDASWTDIDSSHSYINDNDSFRWDLRHRVDWFGTARLRAGVAHGRALFYGTAGLAFAHATVDQISNHLASQTVSARADASETHVGFAIGAGVEYRATQNVSLRFEYLYADLGSEGYGLKGLTSTNVPHTTDSTPGDLKMQMLRFGVNYHF